MVVTTATNVMIVSIIISILLIWSFLVAEFCTWLYAPAGGCRLLKLDVHSASVSRLARPAHGTHSLVLGSRRLPTNWAWTPRWESILWAAARTRPGGCSRSTPRSGVTRRSALRHTIFDRIQLLTCSYSRPTIQRGFASDRRVS
jgi:hypothetical protein